MITNPLLRRIMILAVLGCVCVSPPLFAQSSGTQQSVKNSPTSEGSRFFSAENRWRLQAVDLQSQIDTVSPEIRAKRNTYLKKPLEAAVEFWTPAPGSGGVAVGGRAIVGPFTELPQMPNLIWAIAKFESFHVFTADAPTNRLIYTELNFRVVQVIEEPATVAISLGDLLDNEITGGRIKNADGTVSSLAVEPERHSEQPGHTYLFAVNHDATTGYIDIQRVWDVTSGKLVPLDLISSAVAARGASKLSGHTITEAVEYLKATLCE